MAQIIEQHNWSSSYVLMEGSRVMVLMHAMSIHRSIAYGKANFRHTACVRGSTLLCSDRPQIGY